MGSILRTLPRWAVSAWRSCFAFAIRRVAAELIDGSRDKEADVAVCN